MNVDHDDDLVARYRRMDDLVGEGEPPGLAARELEQEVAKLHAINADQPNTFVEAERNPCWLKAMQEEMTSITENKTWSLEDMSPGHRDIGLKWVFKLKRNEKGEVVKHKACLVAKGYVQKQGVDFEEVFTPVARLESVWLLLAIAAHHSWEVYHMDVKSAFLNGELKEIIYVQQPLGFMDNDNPDKVLHLHKALYGLRQAPRAWNVKLDSTLLWLKFKHCASEHGMYTHGHDWSWECTSTTL